jgi:hypothetical protein
MFSNASIVIFFFLQNKLLNKINDVLFAKMIKCLFSFLCLINSVKRDIEKRSSNDLGPKGVTNSRILKTMRNQETNS